jgi:hypothetical protein
MQPPGIPEDETRIYNITVNGKNVTVTISSQETAIRDFFVNLGVLGGEGDLNRAGPQSEWLMVYTPLDPDADGSYSEYRITAYYKEDQDRVIEIAGFWIQGYYGNPQSGEPQNLQGVHPLPWDEANDLYVDIDLNGDGDTDDPGEKNIGTKPLIDPGSSDNIGYTNYQFHYTDFLGRAFIWEWGVNQGPTFGAHAEKKGNDWVPVNCRTQRFALDPPLTTDGSSLPPNVAWLKAKQPALFISWSGEITGIYPIIAEAKDLTTNKSTTVESYVFVDPVTATILTWDISLQQE